LQPATGEQKEYRETEKATQILFQIKFGNRKKVATFAIPKQTGRKVKKAKALKLGKKRSDSRTKRRR
jgi:hypothetical protein